MKAIILCTEPHNHSKHVHKLTRPRGTEGSKGARTLGTRSEKYVQGKGPVSRNSRELFGPVKPFVKLGDIFCLFICYKENTN